MDIVKRIDQQSKSDHEKLNNASPEEVKTNPALRCAVAKDGVDFEEETLFEMRNCKDYFQYGNAAAQQSAMNLLETFKKQAADLHCP